jgi:hypothetical protein
VSQNETITNKMFLFEIVEAGELQGLKYKVIKSAGCSIRANRKTTADSLRASSTRNNANTAKADIKG